MNSLMDTIKFALVISLPEEETFGYLIIASFTSDCSAAAPIQSTLVIRCLMQLARKSSIIRIIINLLLATFQAYNWILMNI